MLTKLKIIFICRWKELIGALNPAMIQKLIQVPNVSVEISGLDDDDDVDELIREDNELLMQQITSDFFSIISECSAKVVRGYSLNLRLMVTNLNSDPNHSKPFIPVQELKTLKKYSKFGCGLLLMVFRSYLYPETMRLPEYVDVDQETIDNIQEYIALFNSNNPNRKSKLILIFVSMFAFEKPIATHNHSFPAVFYILLSCFQETSGNLESVAARHAIAGLLYCYRLLMLELMASQCLDEEEDFQKYFSISHYTPASALLSLQREAPTDATRAISICRDDTGEGNENPPASQTLAQGSGISARDPRARRKRKTEDFA